MTGKEALNLLFCTSEGLPEDKVYECKKILEKELNELTKYKRAFEILKEVVNIANLDGTYLLSVWVNTLTPICYLKKEQGKLLEELIK